MNKAEVRDDWVGRIIDGRFALLRWLGGSGSAGVFLTELPERRSQKAAIKLIPADTPDAETHIAGWAAATTLSHPHLVRLFHSGRCQINTTQLLYAVMEYAEEDLSQIVPERPLTPVEAREMLEPVLDALSYLHEKGFVHGHLKPSNIMAVDNQLKLSWEGRHVAGEVGKHLLAPTVYDAPEVAIGTISPAADVWSLGVTLVEALTQHPPVWHRSTRGEPVLPESIPQPFAGIARECLWSDPSRRCTLNDVKARLEPARTLPDPVVGTGGTLPGKLRMTPLIAAALVLLAVVTVLKLRSHQTGPSLPIGKQQSAPVIAGLPPESPIQETRTPKGVTVKGAVAERARPDVPRSASQTIQGKIKVRIRVTVDPSGDVTTATFESPGPSKYFANLALQAARHWKFKPPEVDGQAVSSVWVLRFQFGQTATEVTPAEASP
jgi:TonB family protein